MTTKQTPLSYKLIMARLAHFLNEVHRANIGVATSSVKLASHAHEVQSIIEADANNWLVFFTDNRRLTSYTHKIIRSAGILGSISLYMHLLQLGIGIQAATNEKLVLVQYSRNVRLTDTLTARLMPDGNLYDHDDNIVAEAVAPAGEFGQWCVIDLTNTNYSLFVD